MKYIKRFSALFMLLAMLLPVLSGCMGLNGKNKEPIELWGDASSLAELDKISTKTAPAPVYPSYSGSSTLKVGISKKAENLSPFFATSEQAQSINSLTQLKLLPYERGGRVVEHGIDGEKIEYRGEQYEYFSIADVAVEISSDGHATYNFTLRDDIFFSDGVNLTADDVIFSMYVYLDPSYTGYSNLSTLPISGLELYRSNMSTLYSRIYSGGKSAPQSSQYTEAEASVFWQRLDSAGEKFSADIISYIIENWADELYLGSEYGGKWGSTISQNEGLKVAYAMVLWELADWDIDQNGDFTGALTDIKGKSYDCTSLYPTALDFWDCLQDEYGTLELISDSQSIDRELFDYIKESFGEDYSCFFEVKRQGAGSASSISGIKKTGMYSFSVTLDSYDATAIYAFSFYVAPLHAYASRGGYKYTENKFGFEKGDLRAIREKGLLSVGAGAYIYKSEGEDSYGFERNVYYYLGCPYIKELTVVSVSENSAQMISEGQIDMMLSEYSVALSSSLSSDEYKDRVGYFLLRDDGYGYIGINASRVNTGEASSDASKALRKAFCILFDVYKAASIDNYYGNRASITDYPLSPDSWAYPANGQGMHEKKADGSDIYTPDMTEEQRYKAALSAAREYFVLAGYTYSESKGKLTSAPEGAKMEYEFLICDQNSGDQPCFAAVSAAAVVLDKLGISLRITSISDNEELEQKLRAGEADMWAYAWELSQDPDMYQLYYSKNTPNLSVGTGSNYFFVTDKALDTAIVEARKTGESEKRTELYKSCYDTVARWGVEVPVYVKNSVFIYSKERMENDYSQSNFSDYYSWYDEAYKIKKS